MDRKLVGYVSVHQLMGLISEVEYSIVAPFMNRLFDLMDKELTDMASFEELTSGLIMFCNFSHQELISFCFNMLDEDRDSFVSKNDVFRLLLQFRAGFRVYPINVTRSIELFHIRRGDKINFAQFVELVNHTQYLVFPLIRMQSIL